MSVLGKMVRTGQLGNESYKLPRQDLDSAWRTKKTFRLGFSLENTWCGTPSDLCNADQRQSLLSADIFVVVVQLLRCI